MMPGLVHFKLLERLSQLVDAGLSGRVQVVTYSILIRLIWPRCRLVCRIWGSTWPLMSRTPLLVRWVLHGCMGRRRALTALRWNVWMLEYVMWRPSLGMRACIQEMGRLVAWALDFASV